MSFLKKCEIVLATGFVILTILVPLLAMQYDRGLFNDSLLDVLKNEQLTNHRIMSHPIFVIYGFIGFGCGVVFLAIRIILFLKSRALKRNIIHRREI